MKRIAPLVLPLLLLAADVPAQTVRVYVGTYTSGQGGSRGIYRLRLDLASGALTPEGEPTVAVDPSFLAFSPDGRRLYAVNETGQSRGDAPGSVSAFAVDAGTGALTFLNKQPSGGAAPCHLSLDREGRHVLVANYWGGNMAVLAIEKDGRLGPRTALVQHDGENPTPRDPGPHAHSVELDAAGRFAVVSDLGLDKIFAYRVDASSDTLQAKPVTVSLGDGSGPRRFAFHPNGRLGYSINELDSTVTVLAYEPASGALTPLQVVSTLPSGFSGRNSTAEVAVSSDARFLYGSNRGHDSLAIFAIDGPLGKLSPVGHQSTRGRHPRHFAIDPTGAYLIAANRDSDNLVVFRIDRSTGRLEPIGEPVALPRPVCVRMRLVDRPPKG